MRALSLGSLVTAATLVVALAGSSTARADVPEPPAPGVPDVPAVAGPVASGLVITGRASVSTLEAATASVLDGDASVDDVTTVSSTQRVVAFDDPVSGAEAERMARELTARSDVVLAEPNYVRRAADAPPVQVNDPLFGQQTHLWDTTRPLGGYSTKAPGFWVTTRGVPSVRVAVLDTGMTAHPDLTWQPGTDIVDGDNDPTDPGSSGLLGGSNDWHGTHVAGIVAARADNGIGVAGVAPGVSIVPVRVLDGAGSGDDSDIAAGIRWAATTGQAQVVNMSLGGPGPCTTILRTAIAEARARGVVMVAAAGNENADAAGSAPANCPGVIAVGATDAAGRRAGFSNYGSTVDISAPGVDVLSTVMTRNGPGYARESGTSMASPAVAAAAGLLFSTGLNGAQVEATLPQLVVPAASPGTAGVLDLRSGRTAAARPPSTRVSMRVTPKVAKGKRASVRVRLLSSTGVKPYGHIRVFDNNKLVRRAVVSTGRRGSITVKTPRLHRKGVHRIKVVFLGDGRFGSSRSVTRSVTVR